MEDRTIDGLVAERIIGFTSINLEDGLLDGQASCLGLKGRQLLPFYTADIANAWQVVEKLDLFRAAADGSGRVLRRSSSGEWEVGFRSAAGQLSHIATGTSAAEAICLAGLRILNVGV